MRWSYVVLALFVAVAAGSARADGDADRARLLAQLDDETEASRQEAKSELVRTGALDEAQVRAALAVANARAKPLLLEIAGARGMKGLESEVAHLLTDADLTLADAAARALVRMGDEATERGIASIAKAGGRDAEEVRVRLVALAAQRRVEAEVFARWRRKGGNYEGRYAALAKLGWPVQPVLFAMLLDVPLEYRDIALPAAKSPAEEFGLRKAALEDITLSRRRGYRTFEPVPGPIDSDELFELAHQALRDVADVNLMGDLLEHVADARRSTDARQGMRRGVMDSYALRIEMILAERGRPERLQQVADDLAVEVEHLREWLDDEHASQRSRVRELPVYSYQLTELAEVEHQLRHYERAQTLYLEAIKIGRELSKKDPAISGYNRACALARLGRKDEAIAQLDRALDKDISSGIEDLTLEWVTEDGDLASLHDDPRFAALVKKHFGASAQVGPGTPTPGVEEGPDPAPNPPDTR